MSLFKGLFDQDGCSFCGSHGHMPQCPYNPWRDYGAYLNEAAAMRAGYAKNRQESEIEKLKRAAIEKLKRAAKAAEEFNKSEDKASGFVIDGECEDITDQTALEKLE